MSQMLIESEEAAQRVRELLKNEQGPYSVLGEKLRALDPSSVITIARGSSDHAANYAAYLIPLCTGRIVSSLPPSVITVLNAQISAQNNFALCISQSGGSPDILAACQKLRKSGALTAALVNDTTSALALAAEFLLPQTAGVEKSLAATKSVLCTLTALAMLTAEWSQDEKLQTSLSELPEVLAEAYRKGRLIDAKLLGNAKNAFVISRALGQSAALETALKLKEVCGIHAEAFSSAEVRHGPREVVNEDYVVIAFALEGAGANDIIAAARELHEQGARVIVFLSFETPEPNFGERIRLPDLSDMRLAPIVALQMIYPWLARAALTFGRDPDHPKTLKSKVIRTV
jgi:glucosamine--fructose-6-phosphate aminotransferase (isomerizing)